jgi:hypothetical protein
MASEIMVCIGIILSFNLFIPYSVPQYVCSGLILFVSAEVLEGEIFFSSITSLFMLSVKIRIWMKRGKKLFVRERRGVEKREQISLNPKTSIPCQD